MDDLSGLGTILGVWAHPDDEAYLMGGLMALGVASGQHVACVTATAGESGESADPARWPPHRLAEIRRRELAESLALLGVEDHEWLHHADGALAGVDPGLGIDQVAAALDRVGPDTVMTFAPDGMTGHPDHVAVGAWTTAAVARRSSPPRLLLATKTAAWADRFHDINEAVFPDGPPRTRPSDLALDLELDDATVERKVQALEAQASQTTGLIGALGRARFAEWVRAEMWCAPG